MAAVRRLGDILGRERVLLGVIGAMTVVSVTLVSLGPWLLGRATDVIVDGVAGDGIDFGELHRRLVIVGVLYLASWVFGYGQAYLLAGVVQRSMYRLRESVEAKLNRLPLSYLDRQERGDLLSRVTNDIDNLAQSMQQTVSQIVTSLLTLIGVAARGSGGGGGGMVVVVGGAVVVVVVVVVGGSVGGAGVNGC